MTTTTPVTSTFPIPILTPFAAINQPPTHTSLQILQREINDNASSVHSYLGGGLHGHLALVIPAARYLAVAGVAFDVPVAPPPEPVVPPAATAIVTAEAHRRHADHVRIFQRFHDTDRALLRLILAATPSTYTEALSDPEFGYAGVSTLALLTHLHTTYGQLTGADRDVNLARMNAPWSPPVPIEALFKQLTDGQRQAAAGGEPISDTQVARMGYNIVFKTGLFTDACREWRLKTPAEQTMADFQLHFTRMERDRLESMATTASAGYNGTAFQTTVLPHPTTTHAEPALTTHTALAALALPSGPELIALLTELATYRAANSTKPNIASTPAKGYCWTHGTTKNVQHTSATCLHKGPGHIDTATFRNKQGGATTTWEPRARRKTPPT